MDHTQIPPPPEEGGDCKSAKLLMNLMHLFTCIFFCGTGKTEELQRGFDDTVTSPTSVTFAIYNGLWAYGGW